MAASDYEVLDERFRNCVNRTSHVERLWTGAPLGRGAGLFRRPAATCVWSDIPNNRIMRYDETDGTVSVFRAPCGQYQRQHRRPAGPARHLRARRAPRHPHRA